MNRNSVLGAALVAVLGGAVVWQFARDHELSLQTPAIKTSPDVVRRPGAAEGLERPLRVAPPREDAPHPLGASDDAASPAPNGGAMAFASPTELLGRVGEAVHVTARIVDADGAPLPGARAFWLPSGPTLRAAQLPSQPWENDAARTLARYDTELPGLRLAILPQALADSDGRIALDVRHVPADEPDNEWWGAAPPLPALLVSMPGLTVRTVLVEHVAAGTRDLGDIVLETQARVSGRAVDEDHRPLAGVRVRVWRQSAEPAALKTKGFGQSVFVPELMQQLTAADGRFALDGLWQGEATLELMAPDRVRRELKVQPLSGQTLDSGDVVVKQGAAISGRVLDAGGLPVVGAKVSVVDGEIHGGSMGDLGYGYSEGDDSIHDELAQAEDNFLHASVRTDDTGAFRVASLDSPQLSVYATADGFEPGRLRPASVGSNDLRLVLQREALLRITVIDRATRAPVTDARVFVTRMSGVSSATADVTLRVEATGPGSFLAHGAGPRLQQVMVSAPGYANGVLEAPGLPPAQSADVQVELGPQAVLAGRVRDAHDAPLAGALVTLHAPGQARHGFREAQTDAGGVFRMEQLGALTADVVAFVNGSPESVALRVELADGEQCEDLELRIPAPARIHGTVFGADGAPKTRTSVWLDVPPYDSFKFADVSERFVSRANPDAEGRYAFELLQPGEYQVKVDGAGTVECTLAEGEDRLLDFHEAAGVTVHGRVTSGGKPVAGAPVTASKDSAAEDGRLGWVAPAVTDDDGMYSLPLRVGGDLEVYVDAKAGRDSERHMIHAPPGAEVVVDIELAVGHIAGRAVDDVTGAPVAGLEVVLYRDDTAQVAYASTTDDGSFRLDWLPADAYRLRLSGRGQVVGGTYGPMVVELEPRDVPLAEGAVVEDMLLSVCRGATLEGVARLADGTDVKDNVLVQLVRVDHGQLVPGKSSSSQSGGNLPAHESRLIERPQPIWANARTQDGRFRLGALPAGEYRVLAGSATAEEVLARGQPVLLGEHESASLALVAR